MVRCSSSKSLSGRKPLFSYIIIVALSALIVVPGCKGHTGKPAPETAARKRPVRIVSLAPTITEILFAIGLDREIVGDTTFCNYPPKAKTKTRTGGLIDTNFETILALRPDLVIAMPCHAGTVAKLRGLGVNTLTIRNETVDDLLGSIVRIGKATGRAAAAEKLAGNLRSALRVSRAGRPNSERPRVMIVVGRNPGTLQSIYVSGKNTFFNDLLEIAGGANIFGDVDMKYPQPSLEEIVSRNPQIIVETLVGAKTTPKNISRIAAEWNALGDVDAVKHHRIYIWTEDYVSIPGPRLPLLLNKFRQALNGR